MRSTTRFFKKNKTPMAYSNGPAAYTVVHLLLPDGGYVFMALRDVTDWFNA